MFFRVLHISDHSKGSKGLKDPKEYITIHDNCLDLNRFIFFYDRERRNPHKEPMICILVKDTNIEIKTIFLTETTIKCGFPNV